MKWMWIRNPGFFSCGLFWALRRPLPFVSWDSNNYSPPSPSLSVLPLPVYGYRQQVHVRIDSLAVSWNPPGSGSLEYQCLSLRPNWLSRKRFPSLPGIKKRGNYRLRVRGRGEPIRKFGWLERKPGTLYTRCGSGSVPKCHRSTTLLAGGGGGGCGYVPK